MWSHNAFIYSIINALTNTPNTLCNLKLSLADFSRFASFFLPLRSILRGDLQVCTAIPPHRCKAQGCGGHDSGGMMSMVITKRGKDFSVFARISGEDNQ